MKNLFAQLNFKSVFKGETSCIHGRKVPAKIEPPEWQKRGLQFTATGYGRKIPTQYKVLFDGKWRRVYCCQYSNTGTLYIGTLPHGDGCYTTIFDITEE